MPTYPSPVTFADLAVGMPVSAVLNTGDTIPATIA